MQRGTWDPSEDVALIKAISRHGLAWSLVALDVGSRDSRQCTYRWGKIQSFVLDSNGCLKYVCYSNIILFNTDEHSGSKN